MSENNAEDTPTAAEGAVPASSTPLPTTPEAAVPTASETSAPASETPAPASETPAPASETPAAAQSTPVQAPSAPAEQAPAAQTPAEIPVAASTAAPTIPAAENAAPPAPPTAPETRTPPEPQAAPEPKHKSGFPVVPVVAALAVGAVLGGGAGAGAFALIDSARDTGSENGGDQASAPQAITVNRPESATNVTAVAATAGPSVVTIDAQGTQEAGTGSGIVLSADGYVLTNTHVVTLEGATDDATITVTDSTGRIYSAKIVGLDPVVDLAVIKLEGASGLTPIEWASSSDLNVGDQTVVIGAPLGLSNSVSDGIVSALNRGISIQSSAVPDSSGGEDGGDGGQAPFDFWHFDFPNQEGDGGQGQQQQQVLPQQTGQISIPVIQTDAAVNPGNSGGALVDSEGKLIGVIVAIAGTSSGSSGQSGSIGVGFAIPSDLAHRVADELIENGTATHGLLGATVSSATADDGVQGAVIQEVTGGSAAAEAGLRAGDILRTVNGVPVSDQVDLTAQIRALAAGSEAKIGYVRDGKAATVTVTLGTLQ